MACEQDIEIWRDQFDWVRKYIIVSHTIHNLMSDALKVLLILNRLIKPYKFANDGVKM